MRRAKLSVPFAYPENGESVRAQVPLRRADQRPRPRVRAAAGHPASGERALEPVRGQALLRPPLEPRAEDVVARGGQVDALRAEVREAREPVARVGRRDADDVPRRERARVDRRRVDVLAVVHGGDDEQRVRRAARSRRARSGTAAGRRCSTLTTLAPALTAYAMPAAISAQVPTVEVVEHAHGDERRAPRHAGDPDAVVPRAATMPATCVPWPSLSTGRCPV